MKLVDALIVVELIKLSGRVAWVFCSVQGIALYGVLLTEILGVIVTLYLLIRDKKGGE